MLTVYLTFIGINTLLTVIIERLFWTPSMSFTVKDLFIFMIIILLGPLGLAFIICALVSEFFSAYGKTLGKYWHNFINYPLVKSGSRLRDKDGEKNNT